MTQEQIERFWEIDELLDEEYNGKKVTVSKEDRAFHKEYFTDATELLIKQPKRITS